MEYYKLENLEKLIRDSERLAIIKEYVETHETAYIEKQTLLILLGTKLADVMENPNTAKVVE